MRRFAKLGGLAAGTTVGGFAAGVAEAAYRDVELLYGGVLYAAVWALAGLGLAVALAILSRREVKGLITAGAAISVFATTLMLARFIVFRDVLKEAPGSGWQASVAGLIAASIAVVPVFAASRWMRRRLVNERASGVGLWVVPLIAALGFALLTRADDDAISETVPASMGPMRGQGVILVVVDTLRADMLGAYGASSHRGAPPSPHFDAFAARGTRFDDVTAQASWTKPAMASIFTSRHVSGHNTMSKVAALPAELPTVAAELAKAGVKTAAVTTNYNLEQGYGFDRGFDEYLYLPPARYLGAPARANRLAAYNVYRLLREKTNTFGREARYFYRSAQAVNAAALRAIDRIGNDRFFLYLHYMEPHDPYFAEDGRSYARVSTPSPRLEAAGEMRAAYRDGVRRWDRAFGELLAALRARELDERVTIIVTADHGEEFGEHGGFWHGSTLYEEQIHVPLVIRGGRTPAAADTGMARQIDVAPTILGVLGVAAPSTWEGRDLFGSAPAPTAVMAEQDHDGNVLAAVRHGDHKLQLANAGNPRGLAPQQLFDLTKDPGEQTALEDAKLVETLRGVMERLRAHAAKGGAAPAERAMDAEVEAELRSLGYVH